MPFYSRIKPGDYSLGREPITGDEFVVDPEDRFAGTYIIGKPGFGKTSFLKDVIGQDIRARDTAVIFIDPHGDAVVDLIAEMAPEDVQRTYVLDMLDEAYPFGLNVFGGSKLQSTVDISKRVNSVFGLFKTLWPEVENQAHLPSMLRNAVLVLLSTPGSTLYDMLRFLDDEDFRAQMLANYKGSADVRRYWETRYNSLSKDAQESRAGALLTRLHSLFTGQDLMKNILGQRRTTINFGSLIDQKAIVFIKFPLHGLEEEVRLLGTMLVSLIHGTIFSYAETAQDERPGVSFYVDEFQNFATKAFSELIEEGRKYKVRLTIGHQTRGQLPSHLDRSTSAVRTVVSFCVTTQDAPEMSRYFPSNEVTIKEDDIEPEPIKWLLKHGCRDQTVNHFLDFYVRTLDAHRKHGQIEFEELQTVYKLGSGFQRVPMVYHDPLIRLNPLLRDVMKYRNADVAIPQDAVIGFANAGKSFLQQAGAAEVNGLLNPGITYPAHLVAQTPSGLRWIHQPSNGNQQLYHFIFHLRYLMGYLAEHPIGTETRVTSADVAGWLSTLHARDAFVRSHDDVGVIRTHDTPPKATGEAAEQRMVAVRLQTRKAFCRPREDVERELEGLDIPDEVEDTDDRTTIVLEREDDTNDLPDRWE